MVTDFVPAAVVKRDPKGHKLPWERAAKATGNAKKRQSLRLCLRGKQSGGTRLDLAELLSLVRRQRRARSPPQKRQQFAPRRPIRPENASALAVASNPGERAASGEAEFS
jgi:hypothetical protein